MKRKTRKELKALEKGKEQTRKNQEIVYEQNTKSNNKGRERKERKVNEQEMKASVGGKREIQRKRIRKM